jgi:uncharacterized membrane protein (DUF485 family)
MTGLDHADRPPAEPPVPESPRAVVTGRVLFSLYLVLYGGFVLANAFAPGLMARSLGGVNYAVLSGLGLIAAAFVLAVVYDLACRGAGR